MHEKSRALWRTAHPWRAVTLVEMLVVMGIILVIGASIVVASLAVWNPSKIKKTKALLDGLSVALEEFRTIYRTYPPDDMYLTDANPTLQSDDWGTANYCPHLGNRSLYLALEQAGLLEWLKGSSVALTAVYAPTGDDQVLVIVDAWDQPIFYDSQKPTCKPWGADGTAWHTTGTIDALDLAANTLTDATLPAIPPSPPAPGDPDRSWIGHTLVITEYPAMGQTRRIIAYDHATHILTLSDAWRTGSEPQVGDAYVILEGLRHNEASFILLSQGPSAVEFDMDSATAGDYDRGVPLHLIQDVDGQADDITNYTR